VAESPGNRRLPAEWKSRSIRYNDLVEFQILGPLEITGRSGKIALPAAKPRTLLGVLLLHANEVVSQDRLTDELWGERMPSSAIKLVQTYIGKLRSALGSAAIETRSPGYLLRIDEQALDAACFRRLVGEARRLAAQDRLVEASSAYCEALLLWRGPALADLSFESFAHNAVDQLEEERLIALMDRIDCDLMLGHDNELVPELETLIKQHPLRERPRAQLMLALYRSGRQADALNLYRDTRLTLRNELGLQPSPRLRELEREILRHDPRLGSPPKPPPRREVTRRRRLRDNTHSELLLRLATELGDFGRMDVYADKQRRMHYEKD
jgi:DNA-binding SARP family transcriptional activator